MKSLPWELRDEKANWVALRVYEPEARILRSYISSMYPSKQRMSEYHQEQK
jgi:hypothetical protein